MEEALGLLEDELREDDFPPSRLALSHTKCPCIFHTLTKTERSQLFRWTPKMLLQLYSTGRYLQNVESC